MNNLELLIYADGSGFLGSIDLIDSDSFGFRLTKTLASLKDISLRSGNYSLDFEAPNSANNNRVLFGMSDVNSSDVSRQIIARRRCLVKVNGNQLDVGYIKGIESTYDGNYKMVFVGGNTDWTELIGDVELHQLPWRDITSGLYTVDALEEFSDARIATLSTSNSSVADITYPVIDRNNGDSNIEKRPVLHMKAIWLSIQKYIGLTFVSDFLDSVWVSGNANYTDEFGTNYTHFGIGYDPAFNITVDAADIDSTYAEYNVPDGTFIDDYVNNILPAPVLDPTIWIGNIGATPLLPIQQRISRFTGLVTNEIKDENLSFDTATSTYTVNRSGLYNISFDFVYTAYFFNDNDQLWEAWGGNNQDFHPPAIHWYIVNNNTLNNAINGTILYDSLDRQISTAAVDLTGIDASDSYGLNPNISSVTLSQGDVISIMLELDDFAQVGRFIYRVLEDGQTYWRLHISDRTRIKFALKDQIQLGDPFRINTHIPKNVKVLDLIQEWKKQFNLYFEYDAKRGTVLVEPRDDFYLPLSDAVDITDKIDLTEKPLISFATDYKKNFEFRYLNDSSDKYLERWQKIYDRTYGKYVHRFPSINRFDSGTISQGLNIIAPSINGFLQLAGDARVVTSIVKRDWYDAKNAGTGINNDYAPRMYQLVYGVQKGRDGVSLNPNNLAVLVGLMEGFGAVKTYEDRKLTFNGVGGLVDQFYLKTLANIDDYVDVTVTVTLSIYDFFNLDLKRPVYISMPEQIKGYYLIEGVRNYDVVKERPVSMVLQKYKDYTPATLDGTQTTNVTDTITENETPDPQPITYIDDNGAIQFVLDNNGNLIYSIP